MVDQSLPPRVSALAAHHAPVSQSDAQVVLTEIPNLRLWQLAAWPDSLDRLSKSVASELGVSKVPGFGNSTVNSGQANSSRTDLVAMLRMEPLKFWVIGAQLSACDPVEGAVLDISHSRTQLCIAGDKAATVLNSYLPLDLRDSSFPVGAVASTAFHHIGVTLWRTENGYNLFVPRGFAVSLWELLVEASLQYQLTIA